MRGIFVIFRKEMEDHFSSIRFILISMVIVMVGVVITSMVGISIQEESKGMAKPTFLFLWLFTSGKFISFVQFIGLFGPLIGMFLGFDSINRERVSRTLSKLVSQPIYRDSVINAKFLSAVAVIGIAVIAIVLIISGLGIMLIGVVPGFEELSRLAIYVVTTLLYLAFWLGISILFSVIFRSTATSALASLALWLLFFLFVILGGPTYVADAVAPISQSTMSINPETIVKHEQVQRIASLISPMTLYSEATNTILDPMRKTTRSLILMGPLERLSLSRFQNPLPLLESILIVIPHLISIVAITFFCFGVCYWVFMRQEIRSV